MTVTNVATAVQSGLHEEVAPGVVCDWSADRQFVHFQIADFKHPTLDAWAEKMKAITSTPAGPPYMIYEFLASPSAFTFSYMDRKFEYIREGSVAPSTGRAYIAVVFPNQFAHIARIFATVQQRLFPRHYAVTVEIFDGLKEGQAWLDAWRNKGKAG